MCLDPVTHAPVVLSPVITHAPVALPQAPAISPLTQTPNNRRSSFQAAARNVILFNRFSNIASTGNPSEAPQASVHEGVTASGTSFKSILHPDNTDHLASQGLYETDSQQESRTVVSPCPSFSKLTGLVDTQSDTADTDSNHLGVRRSRGRDLIQASPIPEDWSVGCKLRRQGSRFSFHASSGSLPRVDVDIATSEKQQESSNPTVRDSCDNMSAVDGVDAAVSRAGAAEQQLHKHSAAPGDDVIATGNHVISLDDDADSFFLTGGDYTPVIGQSINSSDLATVVSADPSANMRHYDVIAPPSYEESMRSVGSGIPSSTSDTNAMSVIASPPATSTPYARLGAAAPSSHAHAQHTPELNVSDIEDDALKADHSGSSNGDVENHTVHTPAFQNYAQMLRQFDPFSDSQSGHQSALRDSKTRQSSVSALRDLTNTSSHSSSASSTTDAKYNGDNDVTNSTAARRKRSLPLSLPKFSILDDDIDISSVSGASGDGNDVVFDQSTQQHPPLPQPKRDGPVIRRREVKTARPLSYLDSVRTDRERSRSTENLALWRNSDSASSAVTSARRSKRQRQLSWHKSHFTDSIEQSTSDYDCQYVFRPPGGVHDVLAPQLNSFQSMQNLRAFDNKSSTSVSTYIDRVKALKDDYSSRKFTRLDELDSMTSSSRGGASSQYRAVSPCMSYDDAYSVTSSEADTYMERLRAIKSEHEQASRQGSFMDKLKQLKNQHEVEKTKQLQKLHTNGASVSGTDITTHAHSNGSAWRSPQSYDIDQPRLINSIPQQPAELFKENNPEFFQSDSTEGFDDPSKSDQQITDQTSHSEQQIHQLTSQPDQQTTGTGATESLQNMKHKLMSQQKGQEVMQSFEMEEVRDQFPKNC